MFAPEDKRPLRFVLLATAAGYLVPLLRAGQAIGRDWDYFDALSLLLRSSVRHYGAIPLHDPWMCGGLDLLTNPQTRLLSPLVLLDLTLPPHLANWASFLLLSLAGAAGAYRFFRDLPAAPRSAAVLAVLFVNGTWFALHQAEGHVPFGHIALIPWVPVLLRRFADRRARVALAVLLAHMVLAGGVYAVVFAIYLALTALLVGIVDWRPLLRDKGFTVAIAAGAALVLAARALPAILVGTNHASQADYWRAPGPLLVAALFSPIQHARIGPRFHEYGCYFSLVAIGLLVRYRPRHVRLLVALAIWTWVGTGLGDAWNPWSLHHHLPILNVAHVQTRFLLLAYVCFLCLLAPALERPPRWILGVLVLEALVARTITVNAGYVNHAGTVLTESITSERFAKTVARHEKPLGYYSGEGSVSCYEPSYDQRWQPAVAHDDPAYRGEARVDGGEASIERFVPGAITVRYTGSGVLSLNTRTLGGWRASEGEVVSPAHELLRVAVPPGPRTITLTYAPRYLAPMLWLLAAGVLVLAACGLGARVRRG